MGQVMVDSSLGISKNLIVGGGAHIEGELTVNHITAPVEIQETEPTKVYGTTNNESQQIVGWVFAMGGPTPIPVFSCIPSWNRYPSENSVYTYPHSHHFRNAAMTLVKDNTELRKQGAKNNHQKPVHPMLIGGNPCNAHRKVELVHFRTAGHVRGGRQRAPCPERHSSHVCASRLIAHPFPQHRDPLGNLQAS